MLRSFDSIKLESVLNLEILLEEGAVTAPILVGPRQATIHSLVIRLLESELELGPSVSKRTFLFGVSPDPAATHLSWWTLNDETHLEYCVAYSDAFDNADSQFLSITGRFGMEEPRFQCELRARADLVGNSMSSQPAFKNSLVAMACYDYHAYPLWEHYNPDIISSYTLRNGLRVDDLPSFLDPLGVSAYLERRSDLVTSIFEISPIIVESGAENSLVTPANELRDVDAGMLSFHPYSDSGDLLWKLTASIPTVGKVETDFSYF